MLSDIMEGVSIDVMTGTLIGDLDILAGAVTVMTGGVTEDLIKLLTGIIVGFTMIICSDG